MSQLPDEFETMSPVDGWIVGWMHGDTTLQQREQTPALRVYVGSIIHVRHETPSVRALIQVDGSKRWLEVKLQRFIGGAS